MVNWTFNGIEMRKEATLKKFFIVQNEGKCVCGDRTYWNLCNVILGNRSKEEMIDATSDLSNPRQNKTDFSGSLHLQRCLFCRTIGREESIMSKNRNIYIMYLISLLQGMVFYGPIATLYRQAAGVSVFQITLIESISLALCVLLEVPWGIAAEKIGYKNTMIFCCILYFISKIVFWRADGFGMFLLERVMLSVVISGLSGVDASILYLSCKKEKSQAVFGIYNNLNTAGLLAAAGVYAFWVGDDYRLAGQLTVISYGVAAVLALGLREVRGPAKQRVPVRKHFPGKSLLLFLIGVALLNETHQTITVFLNQLQYVKCGISDSAMGVIYIAVTLSGLIGGLSARLTGRLGQKRMGIVLFAACGTACLCMAFTGRAWLSVAAILVLRISFSLFQPLQMQLQNIQITSADRASALSMNAVLMDSVAIFTNLLYGSAAKYSLSLAMLLGCGFCFLGLLLFLVWFRSYMSSKNSLT